MAGESEWLVLLVQLPASPSSARVAVWRRLRAGGAVGLQNAVWALPGGAAHRRLFHQVLETVREQGGTGMVLRAATLGADADEEIIARFRAERARDYDEYAEQCGALLAEIDKETGSTKFTFAELEETEQDLDKLTGWLEKIRARDFFPNERSEAAAGTLGRCRDALSRFAQAVYEAEGIDEPVPAPSGTAATEAAPRPVQSTRNRRPAPATCKTRKR